MTEYLKTLAGDLLTLEVNTIVKDNMSGGKMPSSKRRVLQEVADNYRAKLVAYGVCQYGAAAPQTEPVLGRPEAREGAPYLQWAFSGEWSFYEIRRLSRLGLQDMQGQLEKLEEGKDDKRRARLISRQAMLLRIYRQTGNLIGLFKVCKERFVREIADGKDGFSTEVVAGAAEGSTYQPFPSQPESAGWNNDISKADMNKVDDLDLSPEHITLLRKAWELGTQQILMQTVVQIDGDVTSYISGQLMNMPLEAKQMLMALHDDSVRTSTTMWKNLFDTVANLAGTAFSQIFAGGKKKA